jgi:glycogen phosphorylase
VDVMVTQSSEAEALRDAILRKLTYEMGRSRSGARERDWYMATALALRDRIVERWLECTRVAYETGHKQVYYL